MHNNTDTPLLLRIFKHKFQIVGIVLVSIGIISIIICQSIIKPSLIQKIIECIGVSLIPAGTIVVAYEYYMRKEFLSLLNKTTEIIIDKPSLINDFERIKTTGVNEIIENIKGLEEIISISNNLQPIGLKKVYKDRINIPFRNILLDAPAKSEIKILGAALMFLDNWTMQEAMKDRIKEGCVIKLLSLDPNSDFIKQRAIEEKRDIDDIKTDIEGTNKKNENFISHLSPELRKNMMLHHYNAPPAYFIFSTTKLMIAGFYLREIRGEFAPHLEIEIKEGGMHCAFLEHFESLWEATV